MAKAKQTKIERRSLALTRVGRRVAWILSVEGRTGFDVIKATTFREVSGGVFPLTPILT